MAKRDYYDVLGVAKTASADDIRKTYRRLARQYHPDLNKAPDAQKRFTEIQEAYDTLSDENKRKIYDQFGHMGEGRGPDPRGRQAAGGAGGSPHYTWTNVGGEGAEFDFDSNDVGSMFEAFFGGRGGGFGQAAGPRAGRGGRARSRTPGGEEEPVGRRARARAVEHEVRIDFLTAARGGVQPLRIARDGKSTTIDVTIPKGVADGAKLRVRGAAGGEGDLILLIRVEPHPLFRRGEGSDLGKSLDLYLDLPLTIAEATLGATVAVPTLDGVVDLTIPPGTSSGQRLRLRGRGIEDAAGAKGDLYTVIKVVVPSGKDVSPTERSALIEISARTPNPRSGADWPPAPAADRGTRST
jgi:curved DNA-binding protein